MFLQGAQSNLYQFEKLHPNTHVFKQSLVIDIQGVIDVSALRKAIIATALRHDALRSNFTTQDGQPVRLINPNLLIKLEENCPFFIVDASSLDSAPALALPTTLAKLEASQLIEDKFDLENNYLWRMILVQFSDTHAQFVLLAHHLIVDETSIGILFKDISAFYNGAALPELPTLAPDLQLNPVDEDRSKRIDYWKKELTDLNIPRLPIDVSDEPPYRYQGRHYRFQLPAELDTLLCKTLCSPL